jgi:hypothetical protein
LFDGPRPILYPSGFFRRGHYRGYPRGSTFWVAPWLGAEPGWNEEPMPNFKVIGCVGPAAGRRTYTHTYTLSSLYRRCYYFSIMFCKQVSFIFVFLCKITKFHSFIDLIDSIFDSIKVFINFKKFSYLFLYLRVIYCTIINRLMRSFVQRPSTIFKSW